VTSTLHPSASAARASWIRPALVFLLVASGAIHLVMTPPHFAESTLMGIGFIVAAIAQLGLAGLIALRPARVLYLGVALASVTLVSLYCVNVAVGLPFAGSRATSEVETVEPEAGHLDDAADGHGAEAEGHADANEQEAEADSHGDFGIRIGSGEPVDPIGGANLAIELASIALAVPLLKRGRSQAP